MRLMDAGNQFGGTATISIADAGGRVLKRYTIPAVAGHASVRFVGWPSGVYLVTLRIGAQAHTEKLIIK